MAEKDLYNELFKDGWFPFIEIIGNDYKILEQIYKNRFDFENRIENIINSFDENRIKKIFEKWWKKPVFKEKEVIIRAGINAYLTNNIDGFINCTKNLLTELEGILRLTYFEDTKKGNFIKASDFLSHIGNRCKQKSITNNSLLLPQQFLEYLEKVLFANFDIEIGDVELSRHSSSHGIAKGEQYTKMKALQIILSLDQIYFYL